MGGSDDQCTLGVDGPGVGLSGECAWDRVVGRRGASRIELGGVEGGESGSAAAGVGKRRTALVAVSKGVKSVSVRRGEFGGVDEKGQSGHLSQYCRPSKNPAASSDLKLQTQDAGRARVSGGPFLSSNIFPVPTDGRGFRVF